MQTSFLLMAAGNGSRLGGEAKQLRFLGAKPLWLWSASIAEQLYVAGAIDQLIVAIPENIELVLPKSYTVPVTFVKGGVTRASSVVNALDACLGDVALIHDAARPFLTVDLCMRLLGVVGKFGAVIPLLPSVDSIKHVDENGTITSLVRDHVYRAQTPQVFCVKDLLTSIKNYGLNGTDEASCWTASGRHMAYINGDEKNFKITTSYDWEVATSLTTTKNQVRVGHGFDVHPLVPGRPLVLAGVNITSPLGLDGHSDADIICHAVADAILGASGNPDIGTLFPASDPKYKGADSTMILVRSIEIILQEGFSIDWVDVTLQAQIPRLGGVLADVKGGLARVFEKAGVQPLLNLKVKSGEFVGSVGKGDCMICNAVATLSKRGDLGYDLT